MRASSAALLLALLVPVLAGCIDAPTERLPDAVIAPWTPLDAQRLTPDAQAASEVAIAADPVDPARLIAAANSGGGFGVYHTHDAGATWSADRFTAARVDPPAEGRARFNGLSDPVVAFGADGTAYLAGLAYIPTSAVFVATSADGGRTWTDGIIAHESDLATSFNDKEWLGVHPQTGTLILTWQKEPAMDQLRGVEPLIQNRLDIDFGDIVVARSTDQGRTWSGLVKVSAGQHNNGTQVAFTPDGDVHLLWVDYEQGALVHTVSSDDGVTWAEPKQVVKIHIVPPFQRYARMHTLPALVASPVADHLFAVWHDLRNGDADVYAVASADGGATWSDAVRVNQDAMGNGAVQFYPWAAVDGHGRLHVTFYDARHDAHPRFHFYHAYADGPLLAFVESGNVTGEDFTIFVAPDGSAEESRGIGDYTGLVANARGVFPAWADGRGERVGVWSTRLALPGT